MGMPTRMPYTAPTTAVLSHPGRAEARGPSGRQASPIPAWGATIACLLLLMGLGAPFAAKAGQIAPNPNPADTTLTVSGADNNDTNFTNNGTLNITGTGSLTNTDVLDNMGTLSNAGTIENTWKIDNFGTLTNELGGSLRTTYADYWGQLVNETGGILSNKGVLTLERHTGLTNSGTLRNSGTIDNTGDTENYGTFTNTGTIHTYTNGSLNNSATFLNAGTIINDDWLSNGATWNNSGTITNSGLLANYTGATWINTGTITTSNIVYNYHGADWLNDTAASLSNSGSFYNWGTFTNSGTLENSGTFKNGFFGTCTNQGILRNSGTLDNGYTFDNTGSIINTGTFTNAGTFSGSGAVINDGGTIDNTGSMSIATLIVHAGQTGRLTGTAATSVTTASVAGTLLFLGSNDLTVSTLLLQDGVFNNNGTGSTRIGSIVVGSGSTGGIGGTGSLELTTADIDGTLTIGVPLTGSGDLTVCGSGSTTLTSDSSAYAGTTTVSGGTLSVASGATLGGTITVASGGTLAGYGTVASVINGGTVSPGGSIGTLSVAGDYTQTASGNLRIEVSSTTSDLLAIGGTATLDGTLTIVPVTGIYYRTGQSWTFLTAAGGITGTFATVTSGSWNLRFTPIITATSVEVAVSRLPYATAALSSRAAAVSIALDQAALDASDDMANLLVGLDFSTPAAANAAMNSLSAESYDAYSQALIEAGQALTAIQGGVLADVGDREPEAVAGRTAAPASGVAAGEALPGAADGRWGMFLKPVGLHSRQDGDGNHTGYEAYADGWTGGLLVRPAAGLTLGIAPAFLNQSVALRDNGDGRGTIVDWSLAVLGDYRRGGWYATAVARAGLDRFETSRELLLPGLSRLAKGSWNGWNTSLAVGGGYDVRKGAYTFGPVASLEWQYLHEDGFTETRAGAIGQRLGARSSQALTSLVGARVRRRFAWAWGSVTPELRAGWKAQWLTRSQPIDAAFLSAPQAAYTAKGANHAYQAAVLDAGVTMRFTDNLSATARAGIELFRPDHQAQSVSLGITYSF